MVPCSCAHEGIEHYAVAAKWRALARAHIRSLVLHQPLNLTMDLVSIVVEILLACGAEGTHDSVSEVVANGFQSDIGNIVDLARQFQETSGEAVLSRDFVLVTVAGDNAFDGGRMEDGRIDFRYPSPTASSTMWVICTTDLGLGVEHVGGAQRDGEKAKTTLLLKPKVVLRTAEGPLEHEVNGTESPSAVTKDEGHALGASGLGDDCPEDKLREVGTGSLGIERADRGAYISAFRYEAFLTHV